MDLDGDVEAQQAKFPHYKPEHTVALQAIVEPGDGAYLCESQPHQCLHIVLPSIFYLFPVLYIPPLWVHHVQALEPSLSLSVWSPHVAIELAGRVSLHLGLPIELMYPASRCFMTLLHISLLQAADDVPLPIKKAWNLEQRVAALRIFLMSIVKVRLVGDWPYYCFCTPTVLHQKPLQR